MILASIGPNATIEQLSDLEFCDMDRNYDWLSDGKQYYDESDLANVNNFLQQAIEYEQENKGIENNCVDIVEYNSLNSERKIGDSIPKNKIALSELAYKSQVEPLRIIIMGT